MDDPAGQGESVSCDLADLPCTGDVEEMCGGTLVISLYEVAQPVVITGPSYGGCYTDDINNRVLSGIFVRDDLDMTPEVCIICPSVASTQCSRSVEWRIFYFFFQGRY